MAKVFRVIVLGLVVLGGGFDTAYLLADGNRNIFCSFKDTQVQFKGGILTVSNEKLQRQWKWTGYGLTTIGLKNMVTGYQWVANPLNGNNVCDWKLNGLIDKTTRGRLIAINAVKDNDKGFTSDHLKVTADIVYPASCLAVRYVVWIYPEGPGLRTQLFIKALKGYKFDNRKHSAGWAEFIPANLKDATIKAVGYYNDTQHRNKPDTEILKQQTLPPPAQRFQNCPWANLVIISQQGNGLCIVKESHKCINQRGVDTGAFLYGDEGIVSTGWGPKPNNLTIDKYSFCWANWTIVAGSNDDEMALAVKIFDRMRYPINPQYDIYIMANTWGSTKDGIDGKYAAREQNVLREITSQSDLGIDVQQIDDGWQGLGYSHWQPVKQAKYRKNGFLQKGQIYDVYPDGWARVKKLAQEKHVRLGLWAAWTIPLKDLIWNYHKGDFIYYKLDFARLTNYTKLNNFIEKVRNFVLYTHHKVRINWDVTENSPRIGYFFGREYGNIYLENRKPVRPANAVYIPYLVLRDEWQVSRYLNINKFQVTIQNVEMVNKSVSDAYLYSQRYAVAQALMATPIFFQETHYYTPTARKQIRKLLTVYKKNRQEMFKGYVFPVGDKPDNKSWSGFQNYNPYQHSGYLMIFRQRQNKQSVKKIKLKFLAGKSLILTDLERQTKRKFNVDRNGYIALKIDTPADYRFYKYTYKP